MRNLSPGLSCRPESNDTVFHRKKKTTHKHKNLEIIIKCDPKQSELECEKEFGKK